MALDHNLHGIQRAESGLKSDLKSENAIVIAAEKDNVENDLKNLNAPAAAAEEGFAFKVYLMACPPAMGADDQYKEDDVYTDGILLRSGANSAANDRVVDRDSAKAPRERCTRAGVSRNTRKKWLTKSLTFC